MNLIKIFLTALLILSANVVVFSQKNIPYKQRIFTHHNPLTLGVSKYEVIYETVTKDKRFKYPEIDYRILQIDDTVSVYRSYGLYKTDSIVAGNPGMTKGQYSEIYRENQVNSDFIKKIKNKKKNIVKDHVMLSEHYIYEEPFPYFNWTVTDSVKDIDGYLCKQATTHFRGRDWTVWYTEDIPIQDGPWKFRGLPGLILEAYDSTGDQKITVIAVRNGNGSPVIWERYNYSKTTRERFLKDKREFMDAPWKFFQGYPGPDGKIQEVPKRIRFYNPMELE